MSGHANPTRFKKTLKIPRKKSPQCGIFQIFKIPRFQNPTRGTMSTRRYVILIRTYERAILKFH